MAHKALIITYEFPPSGGGGVQRWAKMAKYLPQYGWDPIVVCAEPIAGRSRDESLLHDVDGVPVTRIPGRHVSGAIARAIAPFKRMRGGGASDGPEPGTTGSDAQSSASSGSSVSVPLSSRIARMIAVPDDAAYWRGSAVREAVRIGREQAVDVVIATGPPFSAMVAGARAAAALGVPLVLDQRDSWRDNPAVRMPTRWHRDYSLRLQADAVRAAALVVGTAPGIIDEAQSFGARDTEFVPNGFDPGDLPERPARDSGPLRLAFMGKVYSGQTDPSPLLRAMAAVVAEDGPASEITFEIIGAWPESIEALARQLGLAERVSFVPYLPHREALERVASADVGVTLQATGAGAEGSCPAKLFEYLGMGLPALVIGPTNGLATRVLHEARGGWQIEPHDESALKELLVELASMKASGKNFPVPDAEAVAAYERPRLACTYARLLDGVVEGQVQ